MAKTDIKYQWAIEDIYSSVSEWEKDYKKVSNETDFSEFKGKLNQKESFLACMKKQEDVIRIFEKLSVYAMMLHDVNTKDSFADSLYSKTMSLGVKITSATAFVMPELTALDASVLEDYIKDNSLVEYDYFLKSVLNEKAHVLSEAEEKLLAESGETLAGFKDIFTKIDNADINFGEIKRNGEKIKITHGTYGVILHGEDRLLRKKTFEQYYKAYEGLINTISSTYYGNVKKNVFIARARKYNSVLDMALVGEDVERSVYDNLIKSVNQALPTLHEYVKEKKRLSGYKKFYMYDMYAPTVPDAEMKLGYEEAYDLVVKGLAPLGNEYQTLLIKAKDERWLSVYETDGKRSGAYSVAVYDTHPYVLLNYQQTTHDVFTIAHEMGHSIHSYFSNKTQPYAKADYKIFVAEVASTVNEVLLVNYLIKNAKDDKLKKYLLSYLLEMIRTTLFRQTQFSEFEEFAHGQVENGEPLTKESMSAKYFELNKKYYGESVEDDEYIKYEWARIPHFYRAFYVYKYATGIISALSIADRILEEGQTAVDDYFKFLSSGGSDSPVELLKIAGVDLTTDKPFERAFKRFSKTLEEFKTL
ncbi:MAG: oligoendopeptidase F [Clostridiales bacterium]|nr:oligoendopeptidase F [Clostridiales bacterium]